MNTTPRILSINNFHYRRAGSDAAYLDHDRLFYDHGWSTAQFSMHHPNNLPSKWSEYFIDELDYAGKYSIHESVRHGVNVLYSRQSRNRLRLLLRQFKPDIVHIHSIYHHISSSILPLLKARDLPVVLTAHDYKLACPAYKMYDGAQVCESCLDSGVISLLRRRCIHGSLSASALVAAEHMLQKWLGYYRNYIDRIICPSEFLLQKLVDWGWPRKKLIYIPNFFSYDAWQPKYIPGKYFLYCGRLAPEKGLSTLLRAASSAGVPLKIAGEGTLEKELEALSSRLGGKVEFLGRLSRESLRALIQNARFVVLPSEWYENAPLSIIEAYACGKPVITTKIGGIPEIVDNDKTGLLFEPGNTRALTIMLKKGWTMYDTHVEEMGRNARQMAMTHFDSDRYYKRVTSLYRTVGCLVTQANNNVTRQAGRG